MSPPPQHDGPTNPPREAPTHPWHPSVAPMPMEVARPPGTPSEQVFYEGGLRHSANLGAYVRWTAFSLLGAAAAWGLQQVPAVAALGWPVWLLAGIGLPGLAWSWLEHGSKRYRIGARRIERESGVFSRAIDALELWRVLDIQFRQSLIDRMFGNARIVLIGTDQTDPALVIHGLPEPRRLLALLQDAIQLARQHNRPAELVGAHDLHGHLPGHF